MRPVGEPTFSAVTCWFSRSARCGGAVGLPGAGHRRGVRRNGTRPSGHTGRGGAGRASLEAARPVRSLERPRSCSAVPSRRLAPRVVPRPTGCRSGAGVRGRMAAERRRCAVRVMAMGDRWVAHRGQ